MVSKHSLIDNPAAQVYIANMDTLKLAEKDRQALQALVRLRNDPGLLKLFEKLAEDSRKSLVRAPEDVYRRLQGRAMFLEELLEAADKAAEVLERLPAAR